LASGMILPQNISKMNSSVFDLLNNFDDAYSR